MRSSLWCCYSETRTRKHAFGSKEEGSIRMERGPRRLRNAKVKLHWCRCLARCKPLCALNLSGQRRCGKWMPFGCTDHISLISLKPYTPLGVARHTNPMIYFWLWTDGKAHSATRPVQNTVGLLGSTFLMNQMLDQLHPPWFHLLALTPKSSPRAFCPQHRSS